MGSRKLIVGAVAIAALAAVAVIGALIGNTDVSLVAQTLLTVAVGLLVLVGVMSQRRTARQVAYLYRKGPRRSRGGDASPAATGEPRTSGPQVEQADLVGALRLMQAQYVGRLDRAQATLDGAAAVRASAASGDESPSGTGTLSLPAADDAYVPVVESALGAGITVTVRSARDDGENWIRSHGWAGRVSCRDESPSAAESGPPAVGAAVAAADGQPRD